jgi:hypothetical protein
MTGRRAVIKCARRWMRDGLFRARWEQSVGADWFNPSIAHQYITAGQTAC